MGERQTLLIIRPYSMGGELGGKRKENSDTQEVLENLVEREKRILTPRRF